MQLISAAEIPRRIVDESNDAILFCDREGRVRYWNRRAERLFGYRQRDILGESIDVLIPLRYREAHWRGFFRAMVKGCLALEADRQVTMMRLDGSEIDGAVSLVLHRDVSGEVIGVSAAFRFV